MRNPEAAGVIPDAKRETEPRLELGMTAHSEKADNHKTNEDSGFVDPDNMSAGVFDGMGGMAAGEVASSIASQTIQEEMTKIPKDASLHDTMRMVEEAFFTANEAILAKQKTDLKYKGASTTATFIKFHRHPDSGKLTAIIANSGDSRVYRKIEDKIFALTSDDSYVQRLVDKRLLPDDQDIEAPLPKGWMAAADTYAFDQRMAKAKKIKHIRNYVTNGLGNRNSTTNLQLVEVQGGDEFLLTSDGIHDNLLDKDIAQAKTAQQLVDMADRTSRDPNDPRAKDDDKTAVRIVAEEVHPLNEDDIEIVG